MSRIGARHCDCCGRAESTSGCVRGYRCGCLFAPRCVLCKKCDEHHHKHCTPELRAQAEQLEINAQLQIVALRERHKINIFEYGEAVER